MYEYYVMDTTEINESNANMVFTIVCEHGNLDLAKEIYNKYSIDMSYNNYRCFNIACIRGHEMICKWLWSLNTNIIIDEMSIKHRCNGNDDLLNWIMSIYMR